MIRNLLVLPLATLAALLAGCSPDSEAGGSTPPVDTPAADVADVVDAAPPIDVPEPEPDAPDVSEDIPVIDVPEAPDEGPELPPDDAPVPPPDEGTPPPPLDLAGIPVDEAAFDHGVRSGDPSASGIALVTRFDGAGAEAVSVVVALGTVEAIEGAVVVQEASAPVGEGGFIRVFVDDLEPDTNYIYAFVATDAAGEPIARSIAGELRTAPPADALVPVTFGGNSCSKQVYKPFGPLLHAAQEDLAFFLLAGDTTYADGATDVPGYRAKWSEALLGEAYRSLMSHVPVIATWDDHEVENNWDPEKIAPSQAAAATQVFFEQIPMREQNGDQTIWRRIRWGRTVEIFVLDCRSERLPSTILGDSAQYISPEQMAWLKDALQGSDAVFKLILNSVPITEMPPLFATVWDRWQGYPKQRSEILDHIVENVDGTVVWLTGDFHFPAITHVGKPGSAHFDQWEILMGPTAHIPNPLWLSLVADPNLAQQFPFADGTLNYTRFHADPIAAPPTLTVEFINADNEVFHTTVISAAADEP